MSHFDERGGTVNVITPWGYWYQTIDEVIVMVKLPHQYQTKDICVSIQPTYVSVSVTDTPQCSFNGNLWGIVVVDECVWTLEDRTDIRLTMMKSCRVPQGAWTSLMKDGRFAPDALQADKVQQKMTLERFARENPGMDFANAKITGNYQGGGPTLPTNM